MINRLNTKWMSKYINIYIYMYIYIYTYIWLYVNVYYYVLLFWKQYLETTSLLMSPSRFWYFFWAPDFFKASSEHDWALDDLTSSWLEHLAPSPMTPSAAGPQHHGAAVSHQCRHARIQQAYLPWRNAVVQKGSKRKQLPDFSWYNTFSM